MFQDHSLSRDSGETIVVDRDLPNLYLAWLAVCKRDPLIPRLYIAPMIVVVATVSMPMDSDTAGGHVDDNTWVE